MADAFNLLRSNDLIWSYVVNNYMLGKDPMPFDLLYWNADSTRMPAGVHSFYLRECYMANKLSQGKMVLDNVRDRPQEGEDAGLQSRRARGSHRAAGVGVPRRRVTSGGPTRLVVSGSGHIAGVVNPPEANKYQYWTNDKRGGDARGLAEGRHRACRLLVAGLGQAWITDKSGHLVPAPVARQRQAEGDRGCTRKLCAGPRGIGPPP